VAALAAAAAVLADLAERPARSAAVERRVALAGLHGTLVRRTFRSAALQRTESMLVYLPPGYTAAGSRYPLIMFLHGVPGRPADFVRHGFVSRLDALVAARSVAPFVAAFPAGSDRPEDDNEWADSAHEPGERWETYLAVDVVNFVQGHYRVSGRRAIAGMSMGGFGAMNVALRHRRRFVAVAAWSGYFNANTPGVHDPGTAEGNAYSPAYYVPRMRPPLRSWHPALRFYAGSRDRFAGENTTFDRELTRLGVSHSFRVVSGAGHDWELWIGQLPVELASLTQSLS
jgi:enterochelin esterase-like enzyme